MSKKNPMSEFQRNPTVIPEELKDLFSKDNLFSKDSVGIRAGNTSFTLHGKDPASEAYSVLLRYSEGTMTQLFPTMSGLEMVIKVFDHYVPNRYVINTTTGVITVDGWFNCKPTYLMQIADKYSDSSAPTVAYFNANKDPQNFCLWMGELNGDNKDDLIIACLDVHLLVWMIVYAV